MRVIFLIGFMGSGKSTLGRALAQRVPGCAFIDLDEEIERRAGMSVREIFDTLGQERFRALEADTLRSLCPPEGTQVCVVATGGGTPCRPGAMEWMNAAGTTVLLRASDAVLLRRLLQAQGERPLLRGMDTPRLAAFIREEQLRRAPAYTQALATFPSDLLENEAEIEQSCNNFIKLYL
ncbi:MAG TPA: shikimate kinase [Porphyromonadaceae bacterium]|nr:shikimate kinase [Porphyromonadaceae bacterium]